jgi:hypothetical protein
MSDPEVPDESIYFYGGSNFNNGSYFGVNGNNITTDRQKGAVELYTDISNVSVNSGSIAFGTHSAGTSFTWRMLMFKTGNFLFGSNAVSTSLPADSGERLQVTGTSKLAGKVTISDASTETLLVTSSAFNSRININNTNAGPNTGISLSHNSIIKWVLAAYGTTADFTFYNNALLSDAFFIKGTSNNVIIGSTTDVASALLNVTSTTKGFLPPRMTTTQKNAITSPAAGLVVYDTTLAKLCVYTTAWETITSI